VIKDKLLNGLLSLIFSLSVLVASTSPVFSAESVTVANSDQLAAALGNAKPGTHIVLQPGNYQGGIFAANVTGTEKQPIVVEAADVKRPPVILGGNVGLHLADCKYVEIKNLVIRSARGNGVNIDDGGTFATPSHHITLNGLTIEDIGPNGNRDGIKLSGVDDFVVKNCTVKRWGNRGSAIDMVGCHQGEIVGCTFQYGDETGNSGVQTKGGSRGIRIHHCRFNHAGQRAVNIGGNTDLEYFRPEPLGYEAKDITVSDCTFVGSISPIAFVGVDGASVRHNTFYRPTKWVFRILQESTSSRFFPCRNGRFEKNIVVFQFGKIRAAVNIGPGTQPKSFRSAGNYWYCDDNPSRSQLSISISNRQEVFGVDPQFQNVKRGDFRLKSGSPARIIGPRPATK